MNPLVAEPDTAELDWAGAFSTTGSFTLPATLRFTPAGSHVWWGRTEFSASFDSLSSVVQDHDRDTHFGDRVTAIVDGCSDTDEQPKPPWRERKERHLQTIGYADASRAARRLTSSV